MTLEKHYSVAQLSKILNISQRTLWTWVKTGRVKSVKVNRLVRIPASALAELGFSVSDDPAEDSTSERD